MGARDIYLLHGCNLNMLGKRDPAHYGSLTLAELEDAVEKYGSGLGFTVHSYQTNHEGDLVQMIHSLIAEAAGIIINPGAWTHYSYAIRDALEMVEAPVVEVHLSDISSREEWRRHSVITEVSGETISGKGLDGYMQALDWLEGHIPAAG